MKLHYNAFDATISKSHDQNSQSLRLIIFKCTDRLSHYITHFSVQAQRFPVSDTLQYISNVTHHCCFLLQFFPCGKGYVTKIQYPVTLGSKEANVISHSHLINDI
jgi:hypothetical protein